MTTINIKIGQIANVSVHSLTAHTYFEYVGRLWLRLPQMVYLGPYDSSKPESIIALCIETGEVMKASEKRANDYIRVIESLRIREVQS